MKKLILLLYDPYIVKNNTTPMMINLSFEFISGKLLKEVQNK